MDYENVAPVDNIGDWYQLFTGNTTAEEPKEVKPSVTNALGELLIYAAQASAYAGFINNIANGINQDIREDIVRDITPTYPNMPPATIAAGVQPLAIAVANREKLVEYSENLAAVVKSIDSILARVKIKEEQQV